MVEQRLSSAQGHQDGRFALEILNTWVVLVLQLGRIHPYPYTDGCIDQNMLVLVQESLDLPSVHKENQFLYVSFIKNGCSVGSCL